MIRTDNMEAAAFEDNRPTVKLRVTFNENQVLENDNIISASFQETVSENNLTIGAAFSQSFEMKFRMPQPAIALTGGKLIAEASFDETEWVKLGFFYISSVSTDDGYKSASIIAIDRMALLTDKYIPTISLPAAAEEILEDIAAQYSFKVNESTECADLMISELYEGTVREYIGWLAGLSGMNARFDRGGELTFSWYSESNNEDGQCKQYLDDNRITKDGFTLSAADAYTITALISGTDENAIEAGAGKAVYFYNPYMTTAVLEQIATKLLPFSYHAARIEYRGNPAWEVGDIVCAGGSYKIPIMSQSMEFGKKFSATIESFGLSDEEESSSRVITDVKEIQRQLPEIKQMIIEMNDSLLSPGIGYLELLTETIDGSEHLSGFRITDTPTLTDNTKGWLANKNGIGWSSDGFKTISKVGLDMVNGRIYADEMAADAIITNSFKIGNSMSFDGSKDEITFGPGVSISWNKIDGVPKDLAHTSDIPDDDDITTITQTAIQTGDIIIGGWIWDKVDAKTRQRILGINNSNNLQIGTIADNANYNKMRLYAPDFIQFYPERQYADESYTLSLGSGESTFWCDLRIRNGDIYMTNGDVCDSSGNVKYYGSGDNIHANYLYIASVGSASVQALYRSTNSGIVGTDSSSKRYKNSIEDVTDEMLDPHRLYNLPVRQFKWNEGHFDESENYNYDTLNVGFIAEEVAEFYPYATVLSKDKEIESWEVRRILPPMLSLIQEQKKIIDDLTERIKKLEAKGVEA